VSQVTNVAHGAGAGDVLGGVTGTLDSTAQQLPAGGVVDGVTDLLF
jgi:hypothetical protein